MPHTLLLADDSVTIQRVIELTFADEDIDVVAFSDGHRALASLEERRPDIVLADVGMPGPSGYDLARHFRDTPSLAHIPVLLLTGAFEPVDEETARDLGCDGVLTKPFEPRVVVRRVKELLRAAGSGVEPFTSSGHPDTVDASVPMETVELIEPTGGLSPLDQYFEQLDQAITARAYDRPAPARSVVARAETSGAFEPGTGGSDPSRPLLVDAFAALLAAEESDASDLTAAVLPLLAGPAATAAPVDEDAIVERIVGRVLAQLTDRVVRESVADIVSRTAERVVQQEIERIKRNIK